MTKKITFLILIIVLVSSISAYSLSQYTYGNRNDAFDAVSFGMANTGTAGSNSPMGMVLNANNIFTQNSCAGFQVSLNMIKSEQKRAIPMYNSFDAYINEATYSANDNLYYNGAVAAYYKIALTSKYEFGFGLYTQPKYSFDADYLEQVRNNRNSNDDGYPEKMAENSIENEGSLDAYGIALAYKVNIDDSSYIKSFSFGVNLELLQGEANSKTDIFWTDWANEEAGYGILPDYKQSTDRDLDGMNVQLNLNYDLNERTTFAFTYTPKTTIEVDGVYSRNTLMIYVDSVVALDPAMTLMDTVMMDVLLQDYDLPSSYKFAVQFRPRNILRTVINFEFEAVNWSETNDLFDDEINYYVGVEHKIIETIPVRLGFRQTTEYHLSYELDNGASDLLTSDDVVYTYATRVQTPTISLGTGFGLSPKLRVDLGLTYSFREYEALDLFNDTYYDYSALWPNTHISLKDRGWDNPDTVKENIYNFMLSLTYDL